MSTAPQHWRFFRAGGFDQVRLDTAEELLAIDQLDQKLWVALSCPVKGIEFDARTLALVDSDGDGQIRAPELLAAVQWAGERLKNVEVLAQQLPGVPLEAIRDDDAEGLAIAQAARELLADIGGNHGLVTVDAARAAQARYAERATQAWEAAGAQARPLGDATEALSGLLAIHGAGQLLQIGCSRLLRVDFAAAGSILNWVATQQANGCQVQFRDVNRIVAAFFNVIGITEHARVVPRAG